MTMTMIVIDAQIEKHTFEDVRQANTAPVGATVNRMLDSGHTEEVIETDLDQASHEDAEWQ
jgi:hypothetical protein